MSRIRTGKKLDKHPQPLTDDNENQSVVSLGTESVVISGDFHVHNVPASEHNTNQFLVIDGGQVKTRTGAQVLSDIGDEGGDITQVSFTSLDDFSAQTVSSGNADFTTNGSNGITTSMSAGPIINITGVNATTSAYGVVQLIDEDNMSSDSATRVPTQQSVKAYVDTEVSGLVDSAPAALDTLNELAAALNDDASFSTTVTNSLATKLNLSGGTLTGALEINGGAGTDLDPLLRINKDVDGDGSATGILIGAVNAGHSKSGIFFENKGLGSGRGNLYFCNNSTAGTADATIADARMTIINTGEVGIGTTSPAQALDVSGNIAVSGTVDGVDIAARDAVLTSTTTTANAALPLAGGDMTGHLQITATDGSHKGSGAYVPTGSDWQDVLRLGSTSDNGLSILVNDGGTMKTTYYTNRWGCQHEWGRGSQDTGDGNTYQPAMRLQSADSINAVYLYDGTTNTTNIRLSAEGSNDTYFNNSDCDVAIGSTSADGYKLKVTGTANVTTDLTVGGTSTFGSLSDGSITITDFVDEDDMSSDSAVKIPTQQSVKAYVDANAGGSVSDANTTTKGIVELATTAETTTGTDTSRAVTPDGLKDGYQGSTNVDTVGTIGTGTWQGTAIASAYLDSDTAHLSGNQTFSGEKTFSTHVMFDNDVNLYLGTQSNNDYIYSDGSNINLAMDDSDVVSFTDSDVRFGAPIKIVKSSAAVAETSNHGQIWVDSNYNPSELSYTDTSGQDVRITANGHLAQKHIIQINARVYNRYNHWFYPTFAWGTNAENWNSTRSSSSLESTWFDSWNPILVVPHNMTLNEYRIYGNATASHTIEHALLHGTGVTWDDTNADNFSLAQIGSTQSGAWTSGRYNDLGQSGLSVDLTKGDMIMPACRRTTSDTSSTYSYLEICFIAICTLR